MWAAGRLWGAIFFALSALFPAVGAAPPRSPCPRSRCPGHGLVSAEPRCGMNADRFESLLDSAIRGTSPAREHYPAPFDPGAAHARWNAGVLSGESRLAAVIPNSGPAALVLDPWTPMILAPPRNLQSVGALDSGKTVPLDRAVGLGRRQPSRHPGLGTACPSRFRGTQLRAGPSRRRDHGVDPRTAGGLVTAGSGRLSREDPALIPDRLSIVAFPRPSGADQSPVTRRRGTRYPLGGESR